jgi:hypothetical protein
MKIKETLRKMAFLFVNLYTSVLMVLAAITVIIGGTLSFGAWDLLKMGCVTLAGVLPTFMFAFTEAATKTVYRLLTRLHFALTGGMVFGLLIFFGWINLQNAAVIAVVYIVVYIVNSVLVNIRDRHLADKLNERLNAFHNSQNATHGD